MSCISHDCKCGELWFSNDVLSYCPSCGNFNKGEFDESLSEFIQDEVAEIE